jgi:hypothetical protein
MTTPTVVPAPYTGTDIDYLHAPVRRDGALRMVQGAVTVPATTAQNAFIGLVPFQKGARFLINDKSVHVADLDSSTNVTADLGIIYDDNVTYTDDPDAFVSASTAPQAGGFLTVDETAGLSFVAEANGWLAVQVNAATTTEGAITFSLGVAYDG